MVLSSFEGERPGFARAVISGLRRLVKGEDPAPLIAWAESELRAAGGRLFEGYRVGGYPPDLGK